LLEVAIFSVDNYGISTSFSILGYTPLYHRKKCSYEIPSLIYSI
jgi:hypothetical protein